MKIVGLLGRGALIWVVPLIVSFSFYAPTRELVTSYALFKSVMIVTLTLITLAVNLIKPVRGFSPLVVALVYTAINWALDLVFLLPMTGMSVSAYIEQIALGYIVIAALTWAITWGRERSLPLTAQGA